MFQYQSVFWILTCFQNALLFYQQVMHILFNLESDKVGFLLVDEWQFLYLLVRITSRWYFQEVSFFLYKDVLIPVDWDPTTAIIGRLTYKLTSERRMISLHDYHLYLNFWDDWNEFFHQRFQRWCLKFLYKIYTQLLYLILLIFIKDI